MCVATPRLEIARGGNEEVLRRLLRQAAPDQDQRTAGRRRRRDRPRSAEISLRSAQVVPLLGLHRSPAPARRAGGPDRAVAVERGRASATAHGRHHEALSRTVHPSAEAIRGRRAGRRGARRVLAGVPALHQTCRRGVHRGGKCPFRGLGKGAVGRLW